MTFDSLKTSNMTKKQLYLDGLYFNLAYIKSANGELKEEPFNYKIASAIPRGLEHHEIVRLDLHILNDKDVELISILIFNEEIVLYTTGYENQSISVETFLSFLKSSPMDNEPIFYGDNFIGKKQSNLIQFGRGEEKNQCSPFLKRVDLNLLYLIDKKGLLRKEPYCHGLGTGTPRNLDSSEVLCIYSDVQGDKQVDMISLFIFNESILVSCDGFEAQMIPLNSILRFVKKHKCKL